MPTRDELYLRRADEREQICLVVVAAAATVRVAAARATDASAVACLARVAAATEAERGVRGGVRGGVRRGCAASGLRRTSHLVFSLCAG